MKLLSLLCLTLLSVSLTLVHASTTTLQSRHAALMELDQQLEALITHLEQPSQAEQLLERAVPPPPHHANRHQNELDVFESHLEKSARELDYKEDTNLLEHETKQHAALDQEAEQVVSVPLSAEQQQLLTKPFRLPDLSAGIPVKYMHPPITFNLDAERQDKVQNALNTVVNVAKNKMGQIVKEKKWSKKVSKLIGELQAKKLKVEKHLNSLSEQIRQYLVKKKKIQNAILQRKLAKRLKETHRNLKRVRRYAFGLTKQELLYKKHREDLAHTVENLTHSIALLKGIHRKRNYDLPRRGTAKKLLEGYSKMDPDFNTKTMEEAKEVAKLTDFTGRN